MIFCLPAICAVNGWSANMILAIARNRHYSCCHCSVNVKLKELKYDLPYKKTVHRLAITLGLIVLTLVLMAITAIVKKSS